MRFAVGTLSPNTFDDIRDAVASALRRQGHDAVALPYGDPWPSWVTRTPIVLGAHDFGTGRLYPLGKAPPPGAILYDLEQPQPEYIEAIAYAYRLLSAQVVWSWSKPMAAALRAREVSVVHVPFGCVPEMVRVGGPITQDIDVFFYGHLTPRRERIIQACRSIGLTVVASGDCWGADRDELVARSKIVLNLYKYEPGEIEAVRLAYLIANGKCVVSERATSGNERFEGAVKFVDTSDLVSTCARLLLDGRTRWAWEMSALNRAGELKLTLPVESVEVIEGEKMHDSVMSWAERTVESLALKDVHPVLEVGSYDVNGSVRRLFNPEGYRGVDVAAGPGVDEVVTPASLPFDDDSFPVVVSTEMLEHADFPALVVAEMRRVLKPGGALLLTTRSVGFPYHNPPDHFRYSADQIRDMLRWLGFDHILIEIDSDVRQPGVFVTARKPGEGWAPPEYDESTAVADRDNEIVAAYLKAFERYQRAEYLHQAATFCNNRKMHHLAYVFAKQSCDMEEKWEHFWELALSSHYTRRFAEALTAWDLVLIDPNLPDDKTSLAESNRGFSVRELGGEGRRGVVQGSDYPMLTRRGGQAPDDGRLVVTGHNEFGRMPHSEGPGEEDIGEAGDETPGSA